MGPSDTNTPPRSTPRSTDMRSQSTTSQSTRSQSTRSQSMTHTRSTIATVTREEAPLSQELRLMDATRDSQPLPRATISNSPAPTSMLVMEPEQRSPDLLDVDTPTDTSMEMAVETTHHGTERSGDTIEVLTTTSGDHLSKPDTTLQQVTATTNTSEVRL